MLDEAKVTLVLLFVPLYWSWNQSFKVPSRLEPRPGSLGWTWHRTSRQGNPETTPCAHMGRRGAATKGAAGEEGRCSTRDTTTHMHTCTPEDTREHTNTQGCFIHSPFSSWSTYIHGSFTVPFYEKGTVSAPMGCRAQISWGN